ncbi:MAG: M20/M25/M40 family metallo-hydrolase, partial [Oscillospiraceae bacterium]
MKQKITEFIYSHREELVNTVKELVEIPSVKGAPEKDAPFGAEPRRALDKMLEICAQHGLVTGCHDDVMGTADYCPAGDIELGILCHLDVVPAEPLNWTYPPFQLTRRDGKLIGRGTIDDKGPCAAALYALYCVKELGIPLKKGVRLLFGTDEENGSGDLEIYRRSHTLPPMV